MWANDKLLYTKSGYNDVTETPNQVYCHCLFFYSLIKVKPTIFRKIQKNRITWMNQISHHYTELDFKTYKKMYAMLKKYYK